MFKRMAVLATVTCAMTGACGGDGPTGPGSSDSIRVEGVVNSASTGRAIEGAVVELSYWYSYNFESFDVPGKRVSGIRSEAFASTKTDALGRYQLSGLRRRKSGSEQYRVRASSPGFGPTSAFVELGHQQKDLILGPDTP